MKFHLLVDENGGIKLAKLALGSLSIVAYSITDLILCIINRRDCIT